MVIQVPWNHQMLVLGPERAVATAQNASYYIMNNENCEHFCALTMFLCHKHVPPTPHPKSQSLAKLLAHEIGDRGVHRHFTPALSGRPLS